MTWKRFVLALTAAGVMTGCATAALSQRGGRVVPLPTPPGADCKNLGTVIGAGGGTFGGAYIANDELVQYALNDALNKTAEKGGTHMVAQTPMLGGGNGTTTTATVVAIAYQCPPGTYGATEAQDLPPEPEPAAPFVSKCPALEGETTRARVVRCKALQQQEQAPEQAP